MWMLLITTAISGEWQSEPQPLIIGPSGSKRTVAQADAGSSLVMDSGWRCLYSVKWEQVHLNYWTGKYFNQDSLYSKFLENKGDNSAPDAYAKCSVKKGSALAVDQEWHMLFYISQSHGLVSALRKGSRWKVVTISPNATHLLGVDQNWHIVYAYDAAQRTIEALRWDKKLKKWTSEVIVRDIGVPGAEGVVDSDWHVLYSTHTDAPSLDQRGIAELDTTHGVFKQWPLVATYWDGVKWRCELIDQTALPQRPALQKSNHRLFYARRDDVNQSRWFQPNSKPFTTTKNAAGKAVAALTDLLPQDSTRGLGFKPLDQELDTYQDDQNYSINWNPNYAKGWQKTSRGSYYLGSTSQTYNWHFSQPLNVPVYTSNELTAVECYIPEWVSEVVPPRLTGYRSLMDQRRGHLVHQTSKAESGFVHRAVGWVPVNYVYRRADGRYVKLGKPIEEITSNVWRYNYETQTSYFETVKGAALQDSEFTTLVNAVGNRFATLDASAAITEVFLGPAESSIRTLGHPMNSNYFGLFWGRRYQNYSDTQEQQSATGGIATDPKSSFVFYTQAPDPTQARLFSMIQAGRIPNNDSAPPASIVPDPSGMVWIVVIF